MNLVIQPLSRIVQIYKYWIQGEQLVRLNESAHILGYEDLLNRPSIEINTIGEPLINKEQRH